MQYKGTLIAVKDMAASKRFYHDVLGLEVVDDFGANVVLTGGIFLQTAGSWKNFIHKSQGDIIFCNNAIELYFEVDDMDAFVKKLEAFPDIAYIHPLHEHDWGQRAIRFCDPDGHIIEVGENMVMVVKKFIASGLSVEETAKRMDVDLSYVESALEQ